MTALDHAREAPEALALDTLEDLQSGMLWVPSSDQHPQPMSHHLDRDSRELWFIAGRNSDLAAAVGQGAEARFTAVSRAQDVHLSLLGPLVQVDSPERLRRLWSPIASAFFDGNGPDETSAVLLRLTPREIALWASPRNPVVFALNILRARASGRDDGLGFHTVLNLAA